MIVKLSLLSSCWLVFLFFFGEGIDGVASKKMISARMSIYRYGRDDNDGKPKITTIGYDKNDPREIQNCYGGQGQSWNFNFYVIHYLDHIWTWDKEEDLPGLTVDFDVGPSPIDNLKNLPTIASSPTSITRRNRFAKSIKGQVTTMPYKKEIVNVVGTIKQIEVPFSARIYATYDDGSVQDFVTFGTYKGQEWLVEPHISVSPASCPAQKSG